MLIDPMRLRRYRLASHVKGVLHVGAHEAQELPFYRSLSPTMPIEWVEPDPEVAARLRSILSNDRYSIVHEVAISDTPQGHAEFHRANNEQSSSLLSLKTHSDMHPEVVFTESFMVSCTSLDALMRDSLTCNFLNLDIQGNEGNAIKGGLNYLRSVQFIYAEVNEEELYEGCMLLPEFDKLLALQGFSRQETEMTQFGWGDAFYVKV